MSDLFELKESFPVSTRFLPTVFVREGSMYKMIKREIATDPADGRTIILGNHLIVLKEHVHPVPFRVAREGETHPDGVVVYNEEFTLIRLVPIW